MFKLIKLSYPSWEEQKSSIEEVFSLLDSCVCSSCKINTYEEMEKSFIKSGYTGYTKEDIEVELECCCVSEDYDSMSVEDKVSELLSTACGCEFMLEEE